MSEEIFIPINRKRMLFMTILYSILGLGAFLTVYYLGENQEWLSPTVFKVASVVILFFFMVVAGTFAKNLRNKSAGVLINKSGIEDNTSSIAMGLIKWGDITEISVEKKAMSNQLLIQIKKPKKYIEKAPNSAVKRLLSNNLANYGTPAIIDLSILDKKAGDMEEIIGSYSKRLGKK